eukprot:6435371-Prymnesium_polylepis.2
MSEGAGESAGESVDAILKRTMAPIVEHVNEAKRRLSTVQEGLMSRVSIISPPQTSTPPPRRSPRHRLAYRPPRREALAARVDRPGEALAARVDRPGEALAA